MSSRSVPFRRTVTDAVSWRQDQAQTATIYILRETGPMGFLLKEEGETKKFKVYLGDLHTCTCPVYKKEKDLCKHICWILLKKFRIPREESESFQLGLVEREINALLRGRTQLEAKQRQSQSKHRKDDKAADVTDDGREILVQREITEEDVCPICQDEFLATREPVTYCRFGCAKSIHIKCMKVWAEHQTSTGEDTIKCPLCREVFGQIEFLQKEFRNSTLQKTQAERGVIHRGVACSHCNQSPIAGRCYRCMECKTRYLCQECYSSNAHSQHEFQYRQKPNQRWRPAQRVSGGVLPGAVLGDLQNRELQDEDYELLLQLDSGDADKASTIPEEVVRSFPAETVREGGALTYPGVQCRVCLRGFTAGQVARRLPCRHKFHKECIDQWLIHQHPTCPVDGTVVWNPLTANFNAASRKVEEKPKVQREQGSKEGDPACLGVISGRRIGGTVGQRKTGPALPMEDAGGSDVGSLPVEFELLGLGLGSHDRVYSSRSRTDPNNHNPGHGQPTEHSLCSRASWLSSGRGSTGNSERDVNSNICTRTNSSHLIHFDEDNAVHKPRRHKPPSGSRANQTRGRPPHSKHSHQSSVPPTHGLINLEPTANGFLMGNSVPSLSERGSNSSNGSTPERSRLNRNGQRRTPHPGLNVVQARNDMDELELVSGRLAMNSSSPSLLEVGVGGRSPGGHPRRVRSRREGWTAVSERRRARSSSIGRKSSIHSGQPVGGLEETTGLFLGSPPAARTSERHCLWRQNDTKPRRSSSLPGRVEETTTIDMVLSGYRF